MSYSVQTVTKRDLAKEGGTFELGLQARLNVLSAEVVSVAIGEQSVTVVLHHSAKAKSDK